MLAAEQGERHQRDHDRQLFVVEGHHDTAGRDIGSALADLTALLASHQPYHRTERYVLSSGGPLHLTR